MKSYRFIIKGRVQGVGFRNFTQTLAQTNGVKGYVKNLDDGSVEAVANLSDEEYAPFLESLKKGPANSRVDSIDSEVTDLQSFEDFEIRY